MGDLCPDEAPLLAFVSLVMPAIAMGNRVVVVPSPVASARRHRLLPGARHQRRAGRRRQHRHRRARRAGQDPRRARRRRRASGTSARRRAAPLVEAASAGNLKATWVNHGRPSDWSDPAEGQGPRLSAPRHAGEEHLGALRRVAPLGAATHFDWLRLADPARCAGFFAVVAGAAGPALEAPCRRLRLRPARPLQQNLRRSLGRGADVEHAGAHARAESEAAASSGAACRRARASGQSPANSALSSSQTGSTRVTAGSASQRRVSSQISCLPGRIGGERLVVGDLPRDRQAALVEADQRRDRLVRRRAARRSRRSRLGEVASPRCGRNRGSACCRCSAVPRAALPAGRLQRDEHVEGGLDLRDGARRHEADGAAVAQPPKLAVELAPPLLRRPSGRSRRRRRGMSRLRIGRSAARPPSRSRDARRPLRKRSAAGPLSGRSGTAEERAPARAHVLRSGCRPPAAPISRSISGVPSGA